MNLSYGGLLMNVFTALTIRCILTLFALLVWPLPRNIERGFGKGLGYIIYLFGYRKKVVNENIKNCLRQLDSKTQKSIAIEHYKYFGLLIVECLHFFVPTKNHYKKYVYKNTNLFRFRKNGISNGRETCSRRT